MTNDPSAAVCGLSGHPGIHLGLQAIAVFVKNVIHATVCMLRFLKIAAIALSADRVCGANRHLLQPAKIECSAVHFQLLLFLRLLILIRLQW